MEHELLINADGIEKREKEIVYGPVLLHGTTAPTAPKTIAPTTAPTTPGTEITIGTSTEETSSVTSSSSKMTNEEYNRVNPSRKAFYECRFCLEMVRVREASMHNKEKQHPTITERKKHVCQFCLNFSYNEREKGEEHKRSCLVEKRMVDQRLRKFADQIKEIYTGLKTSSSSPVLHSAGQFLFIYLCFYLYICHFCVRFNPLTVKNAN